MTKQIELDQVCPLFITTMDPDTGGNVAADSNPTYRVYENTTTVPLLTGSLAAFDAGNVTGVYSGSITPTAVAGFEVGKTYTVAITATVGGITANLLEQFQVTAVPSTVDSMLLSLAGIGTNIGGIATELSSMSTTLSTVNSNIGEVGTGVANLEDAVTDGLAALEPTTTQPRVNYPAGRAYQLKISSGRDGTYKATLPIRLRPGVIPGDGIAVSIDMAPLFGSAYVETVGTPTVSGGSVTCAALGPRDTTAMVRLDGTVTASEERTVTIPVTMDTGDPATVTFDVIGWGG